MEQKPIVPYSRIVGDDGAFEKALKDFDKFADALEKRAAEIKITLGNVDTKDSKALQDAAKSVEELGEMYEEYEKAVEAAAKTEKLNNNIKKEARKLNTDAHKALDELNVELEQQKVARKVINQLEREGNITIEEAAIARGRLKLIEQELTSEIRKQQKEILSSTNANDKENKLLKARETVENKRIQTLEDVRERIAALRVVVQNTTITTEEGRKKIKDYNKEVDDLTKVLGENSDKFIGNKINVGNYTESIKDALNETELFKTGIGALDIVVAKLIDALFASKEAADANTVALSENTTGLNVLAKVNGFLAKIFKKNIPAITQNSAAINRNTVALATDTRATIANSEVVVANTVANVLNTDATAVNTVAAEVNTAAIVVDTDATAINTVAVGVNTESTIVNSQVTGINTASTEINTAAVVVDTQATNINTQATNINTAGTNINTDATAVNSGAVEVNTVAVVVDTDATIVNTEVTAANTVSATTNTAATNTNTAATNTNTAATVRNAGAVKRLILAFRGLNAALKASIIVGIIVVLASLFAIFRQGRAGVIATDKVMQRFSVTAKVLITTLADLGKGIWDLFGALGSSIGTFFDKLERLALRTQIAVSKPFAFTKEAKANIAALEKQLNDLDKKMAESAKKNENNYSNAFNKIGRAFSSFKTRYDDAMAAIKTNDEAIIRAFQIADEIKRAELALINLNKTVRELQMMGDDDTFSLTTQLAATKLAMIERIKLMQQETHIAGLQLEMANAKARADLQANATTIGARANAIAAIKDEVAFTEALLQLNIDLDERKGENVLDDEQLNASVEALKVYKNSLAEIELAKQENAEKIRKIDRDIFEQNLDLLIDLIDKEKQLSEQQVNSTILNYEKRLEEFDAFRSKFKDNAQKELEEFNKLAVNSARLLRNQLNDKTLSSKQVELITKELEKLEKLDLNIQFDAEDSFKLFNGETQFALDDIQKLNEQLQSVGLAEIPVNRMREFIQETNAWLKDTRDLNLSLKQVGNTIKEMQEENIFSQQQLDNLRQINLEIQNLRDPKDLSVFDYDKQLKRIEELEKKKTKIIKDAERERLQLRLNALNREEDFYIEQAEKLYLLAKKARGNDAALTEDEKKDARKNSEELLKITKERLAIQSQMVQQDGEEMLEDNKEKTEKLKEEWERFKKDLFGVFDKIADKFVEMADRQVKANEEKISKQQKAADDQRARAAAGLENTLAFEQKELAKRENEAAKARKRAERLEKIKALWVSYQSYASDPKNKRGEALSKTLRDFAILEAIQASFGDGGLIADKVPTDGKGIIRGRSHNGNGGGIPVLVEGREGILSRRNIENMGGENNFRAFKSMLDKGRISADMFQNQRSEFSKSMPVVIDNRGIERGLEDVRNEIRNKPYQTLNVEQLVNGLKFIETVKTPTKTTRNTYIVKKN